VDNAHGIAIFFVQDQDIDSNIIQEYNHFCSLFGLSQWASFVEDFHDKIEENGAVMVEGNFIIAAYWVNGYGSKYTSADLDLYIIEPEDAYAPWMGQTTPNGFFSADSLDSGDNFEVYTAHEQVETGLYLPVINLYDLGLDPSVIAYCFYVLDPTFQNIITWGPHTMDFSNPAPDPEEWDDWVTYLLSINFYSDWWIPGEIERMVSRLPFALQKFFWESIKEQYMKKHKIRSSR